MENKHEGKSQAYVEGYNDGVNGRKALSRTVLEGNGNAQHVRDYHDGWFAGHDVHIETQDAIREAELKRRATQRWCCRTRQRIDVPPAVAAFLAAYRALCVEHGLNFWHEDSHGAFLVEDYDNANIQWASQAQLNTKLTDGGQ